MLASRFTQFGGAAGAEDALRQMITQRLEQEALARTIAQQQIENQQKNRQIAVQERTATSLAQERTDRLAETAHNNKVGGALRLAPMLKPGQAVAPGDVTNLQEAGMGSLLQAQPPQLASTQYGGTANAPGLRTGAPVGAPTAITSPAKAAETTFTGTQTQADKEAELAARSRALDIQNQLGGVRNEIARTSAEAALARAEAAAAKAEGANAPLDVSPDIETTRSGGRYLDLSIYQGKARDQAHAAANKAGVPVLSKEDAGTLREIDKVAANQDDILGTLEAKLPKDPSGRITTGLNNKLSQVFQTDPELAAFMTWRGTAIATLRALAGSKGLRLNQAEINMALANDIPQITDTVAVAQQKIANIKKALGNVEGSLIKRDRRPSAGSPSPGGPPLKAVNRTTGEVRYSDDGGKTWRK